MITAGFDAEVIRSLHENRRGNISHWAYFLPTLRSIRGYEFSRCGYTGTARRSPTLSRVSVAGCSDSTYRCTPRDCPSCRTPSARTGSSTCATFERRRVWSVARYLWHVVRRLHLSLPDATIMPARRFRLEAADGANDPVPNRRRLTAATLPVEVEILPGKLRLFVDRTACPAAGIDGADRGGRSPFQAAISK